MVALDIGDKQFRLPGDGPLPAHLFEQPQNRQASQRRDAVEREFQSVHTLMQFW